MRRLILAFFFTFLFSCGSGSTSSYPDIGGRYNYYGYDITQVCYWATKEYNYYNAPFSFVIKITQNGREWDYVIEGARSSGLWETISVKGGVGTIEKDGTFSYAVEGRQKHRDYGYFDFKDTYDGKYADNAFTGIFRSTSYSLSYYSTCYYTEYFKGTRI